MAVFPHSLARQIRFPLREHGVRKTRPVLSERSHRRMVVNLSRPVRALEILEGWLRMYLPSDIAAGGVVSFETIAPEIPRYSASSFCVTFRCSLQA